jgi:hypothetical protein
VPLLFSSRLSLERLRHLSIFCRAALILSGCVAHQPHEKRAAEQAVRKGEAPVSWNLFFWSSESCPEIERTNEIDCAQDVVGQDAESGFAFDFGDAFGEEPPACRHSFDGSERVFSGASPLAHEVRIGLDTGVHPLECILVEMTGQ